MIYSVINNKSKLATIHNRREVLFHILYKKHTNVGFATLDYTTTNVKHILNVSMIEGEIIETGNSNEVMKDEILSLMRTMYINSRKKGSKAHELNEVMSNRKYDTEWTYCVFGVPCAARYYQDIDIDKVLKLLVNRIPNDIISYTNLKPSYVVAINGNLTKDSLVKTTLHDYILDFRFFRYDSPLIDYISLNLSLSLSLKVDEMFKYMKDVFNVDIHINDVKYSLSRYLLDDFIRVSLYDKEKLQMKEINSLIKEIRQYDVEHS